MDLIRDGCFFDSYTSYFGPKINIIETHISLDQRTDFYRPQRSVVAER